MHCEAPGVFHVQRCNQNGARADGDRRNGRFFVGPKPHRYADGGIGRRGKFSNQRYCARSGKPRHPRRSQWRAQCRKSSCAAAALHQRPDDNAISLISSGAHGSARSAGAIKERFIKPTECKGGRPGFPHRLRVRSGAPRRPPRAISPDACRRVNRLLEISVFTRSYQVVSTVYRKSRFFSLCGIIIC